MKMKLKGRGIVIKLTKKEITNLYRPNSQYKSESFDYVHVQKGFGKKFAAILLKEWFFLLKPEGLLLLEYVATDGVSFDMVEQELWRLFHGNYVIVSHDVKGKKGSIVVRKLRSLFVQEDSIDRWSFGIITNGERDDWLEEIITSIRLLKIPHVEIIVCGKYRDRKEKDFIYIDFNERSERGWITKKKNLICERARYENLCIVHDRIVFDKHWYKSMKQYGNAFELLGCVQEERDTGEQAGDWITLGGPIGTAYKISRLEYTDWDPYVYLSGQLTIIKKSIWEKVLWDETRYWDGAEDADISFRSRDLGYLIRFNPFAKTYAITWRHGKIPTKYNPTQGLLPKDMIGRRFLRIVGRSANSIPFLLPAVVALYIQLRKTRIFKFFMYH